MATLNQGDRCGCGRRGSPPNREEVWSHAAEARSELPIPHRCPGWGVAFGAELPKTDFRRPRLMFFQDLLRNVCDADSAACPQASNTSAPIQIFQRENRLEREKVIEMGRRRLAVSPTNEGKDCRDGRIGKATSRGLALLASNPSSRTARSTVAEPSSRWPAQTSVKKHPAFSVTPAYTLGLEGIEGRAERLMLCRSGFNGVRHRLSTSLSSIAPEHLA